MDYNELSDLSVTFGSQNKDSHILNAENTLSVIADLSTTAEHQLSTKIYIKDPGVPELSDGTYGKDLSVIKMPIDEYELSVVGGTLSDGVLYVVSADYIDVYSQEIRSLSTPGAVGTSNAANTLYVDETAENLKTRIDLSCDHLNDKIDRLYTGLSNLGMHSTLSTFVENTDDEIKIDDLKDVLKTLIKQLSSIS